MKILIGIASPVTDDELAQLADAGAEEFFCGVMPEEWVNKYGYQISLNRREFPGNHFNTFKDLEQAVGTIHRHGGRAFITFNAHTYTPEQFPLIRDYLKRVADTGADAVICSDVALLLELRDLDLGMEIHISGEAGCHNSEVARFFQELGASRIILPRHLGLGEMEAIIDGYNSHGGPALEFEAFIMGQRCPYSTDNCTVTHGWLPINYCQAMFNDSPRPVLPPTLFEDLRAIPMERRNLEDRDTREILDNLRLPRAEYTAWSQNHAEYEAWKYNHVCEAFHVTKTFLIQVCGLCAIRHLSEIGVCSIKVVSRGDTIPSILERIGLVKKVVDAGPEATPQFCRDLLANPSMCDEGYRCYYRDASRGEFEAGGGMENGDPSVPTSLPEEQS